MHRTKRTTTNREGFGCRSATTYMGCQDQVGRVVSLVTFYRITYSRLAMFLTWQDSALTEHITVCSPSAANPNLILLGAKEPQNDHRSSTGSDGMYFQTDTTSPAPKPSFRAKPLCEERRKKKKNRPETRNELAFFRHMRSPISMNYFCSFLNAPLPLTATGLVALRVYR